MRDAPRRETLPHRAKLAAQLSITWSVSTRRITDHLRLLRVYVSFLFIIRTSACQRVPGMSKLTMDDRFDILIDSRDVN